VESPKQQNAYNNPEQLKTHGSSNAPQDMERKISRAQGHRTEDETRALRERIERLTEVLGAATAEHGMLVEQVKAAEVALQDSRRTNDAFVRDRWAPCAQ